MCGESVGEVDNPSESASGRSSGLGEQRARGVRSSMVGVGSCRRSAALSTRPRLRRRPITRFPSSSAGRFDSPPMSRFGIPPERESLYH
jgi:hypothetical protein